MQISAEGLKIIQSAEKFEPKFYYENAHIATVGWGHALTTPAGQLIDYDVFGRPKADQLAREAMQRMFGKQEITVAEADALLTKDLARFVAAVNAVADDKTYQCEFDAMVSMAFNIGTAGFASSAVARLHKAGTRKVGQVSMSALSAAAKNKASPTDIKIAFVRWSNVNGAYSLGLFRRRLAEVMVYGGMKAADALKTAWSFKG
ncbi:endolysin [Caulobacter phage CcrPW]|uniref:Lysozyme n=1 Tax=Caulobacter phage CcrPW TaxID=2283271 RepID=A0A385EAH6_9CAUD|nr:endolysin [Caulobacter phage CcrPW]AXQ68680.1 lysozyme [Caulobacter phage CcrPW]